MSKIEDDDIKEIDGDEYATCALIAEKWGYSNSTSVHSIAKKKNLNRLLIDRGGARGKTLYIMIKDFERWYLLERDEKAVSKKSVKDIKFPEPIEDFETVLIGSAIISADYHIPFIDVDFFEKMLTFSKLVNATDNIIGGDYFDQDAFSSFYSERVPVSWEKEKEIGKWALQEMLNTYDNIYFFLGNHDKRLAKRLADKNCRIDTLHPFEGWLTNPKVHASSHQKMIAKTTKWSYHVEHPKSIMKVGSITANRRQAVLEQSIIEAHGHRQALERSYSGKQWVITVGCMCDPLKIYYQSIPTSHALWDQGFIWIRDGVPRMVFKDTVDVWIRDYQRKKPRKATA